jgi:hypothetical protein
MKHSPGIVLVALNERVNFSITYVNDKLTNLNFQVESICGIIEVYGRATIFYFQGEAVRADVEIRKFQAGTTASTIRGVCAELAECEQQIEKKIVKAMNEIDPLLDGGYV